MQIAFRLRKAFKMSAYEKRGSKNPPLASATQVRHLVGPVTDDTVLAILEAGASVEELEVVSGYLQGEGNDLDRLGHPLTGKVAYLYDILTADELYANGER
jgi:hypothetical protein